MTNQGSKQLYVCREVGECRKDNNLKCVHEKPHKIGEGCKEECLYKNAKCVPVESVAKKPEEEKCKYLSEISVESIYYCDVKDINMVDLHKCDNCKDKTGKEPEQEKIICPRCYKATDITYGGGLCLKCSLLPCELIIDCDNCNKKINGVCRYGLSKRISCEKKTKPVESGEGYNHEKQFGNCKTCEWQGEVCCSYESECDGSNHYKLNEIKKGNPVLGILKSICNSDILCGMCRYYDKLKKQECVRGLIKPEKAEPILRQLISREVVGKIKKVGRRKDVSGREVNVFIIDKQQLEEIENG